MRLRRLAKDILLTVVSALFSLIGLALFLGKGERAGLAVLAFFGGCTAVGVWSLRRGQQLARHAGARQVEVQEGVPLQGRRLNGWAAGLAIVGVVMALTGKAVGLPFVVIGAGMAALGVIILLLLATGLVVRPSLQFERAGLRFGQRRYSFLLDWENLAALTPGEIHGHDLLLIRVHDLEQLAASVQPASEARRLAKLVRSNLAWYGAELVVMAGLHGSDVALLAQAIKRYLGPPGAEDEGAATPALRLPQG